MLRRTTAILTAALVLGAVAAPAALAKRPSGKGGKKPVGTVASFDGTTLTVTMKDGSSRTATADESTQVKIDHRGRPSAKGNPTRGSLDDLVAGNLVLRMKTDDGALEKVRIRRVATETAPVTTCSDEAGETETETETEGETSTETEGETSDDSAEAEDTCDETDAGDADEADEDEAAEEEEAEEEEAEGDPVDELLEDLPLP